MATLVVTVAGEAERPVLELPIDLAALAAPVETCGRDWRRLHGDDPETLRLRVAWRGPRPAWLEVTLVDADGAPRWRGAVSSTELSRFARRALRAGVAAGLLALTGREDQGREPDVAFAVQLTASDPIAGAPRTLDAKVAVAGSDRASVPGRIAWRPRRRDPVVPPLRFSALGARALVPATDAPEMVLALGPDPFAALRQLAADSAHADQERAVLLFGRRVLMADVPGADGMVPCYHVQSCRVPTLAHASRTAVGFVADALLPEREGHALLGMAHTHLPDYALAPSESDLLDLDSLGAGAISLILSGESVPAGRLPPVHVFTRAGWAGGETKQATACVCVLAPQPALESTP